MTEILKNPKQIAAFNDPTRFLFLLCGRRSGKTFVIIENICRDIPNLPPFGEILYCAPTHSQAKEIIWDLLEQRLHNLGWNYRALPSKNRFELSKKRKIYCMGAEKISRLRGHSLSRAYLDEIAFFGTSLKEVWRVVRPALADQQGGAVCATTPNGLASSAHEFYLETLEKEDWNYHSWTSFSNPYLPRIEVEDAKRELDERSFKQEFMAEWVSYEGLAYYNFDVATHVKKQPPIDISDPLILSLDFNVSPASLLLIQMDGDVVRVKKEYSTPNSSTEQTIINFCKDFAHHAANARLLIRGDAAGASRSSTTGRSDYEYVFEILAAHGFKAERQVLSRNPPIVDRVNKMNFYLKPFEGVPKVSIDISCKELIKDLSSQEMTLERKLSDKGNRGHSADALGYTVYYQDRVQRTTPAATRIL